MFNSLSRAGIPSCGVGCGASPLRSVCRNCDACEHGSPVDGVDVVVSNLIHTLRLYFTQQPLTQFFRSHLSRLRVQASSTRSTPVEIPCILCPSRSHPGATISKDMSPPIESFPAFQLPDRVQVTTKNRRRKRLVELQKCELMEMVQYSCDVEKDKGGASVIKCQPLVRLFRRWVDINFYQRHFPVPMTDWI